MFSIKREFAGLSSRTIQSNDLGSTRPAPSAGALIAATQRLIERAHARHIRFFCSTLTPYEGANYWRPEGESARERFNAFVRDSKSGCDGVVDQDTATHGSAKSSWFLPLTTVAIIFIPAMWGTRR
jgi:hypothetical protein